MDKLELLSERLKETVKKFNALKECGIDEEILTIYLMKKTKLSKKAIQSVLKNTEEFYEKLIKDTALEML